MKKLNLLAEPPSPIDWYVQVRDNKREPVRAMLIAEHAHIASRFASLGARFKSKTIHGLRPSIKSIRNEAPLRACYSGATKSLLELKKAIRDVQSPGHLKYCPMCGMSSPDTWDHYLPGVMFPEYSVHALNLIPCCGICNSTKDDDWLCNSQNRQYLHLLHDALPTRSFLRATLHFCQPISAVGATFSLHRPRGVSTPAWQLIERHFARLRLITRYAEHSNDEITEILSSCRAHTIAGGNDPRTFLIALAADAEDLFGISHWRSVLMRKLASSAELPALLT